MGRGSPGHIGRKDAVDADKGFRGSEGAALSPSVWGGGDHGAGLGGSGSDPGCVAPGTWHLCSLLSGMGWNDCLLQRSCGEDGGGRKGCTQCYLLANRSSGMWALVLRKRQTFWAPWGLGLLFLRVRSSHFFPACLLFQPLLNPPFPEMPTPCLPLGGRWSQRTQPHVGLFSWSCEHEADTDMGAGMGLSLLEP